MVILYVTLTLLLICKTWEIELITQLISCIMYTYEESTLFYPTKQLGRYAAVGYKYKPTNCLRKTANIKDKYRVRYSALDIK